MKRAILGAVLALLVACGGLSATQVAGIAKDGVDIAVCNAKVKDCKADALREDASPAERCYPVYDECMEGHGLKEGGL